MLEDMPDDTPEDMSEDMPDDTSEDMPGDMPEDMLDDTPEDMPGDTSKDMPGDIYDVHSSALVYSVDRNYNQTCWSGRRLPGANNYQRVQSSHPNTKTSTRPCLLYT